MQINKLAAYMHSISTQVWRKEEKTRSKERGASKWKFLHEQYDNITSKRYKNIQTEKEKGLAEW